MKSQHGGKRKGAGKPLLYGEPTIKIFYRIPASKEGEIRAILEKQLKKYLTKS